MRRGAHMKCCSARLTAHSENAMRVVAVLLRRTEQPAPLALRSRVVLKWRPPYGWRRLVKRLLGPPSCGVPEPGCMTLVDELLEYRQLQQGYKRRGGFVAGDDSDDFDDFDDDGGGIVVDDDYYNAYDSDAAYRQATGPAGAWLGGAMALFGERGGV